MYEKYVIVEGFAGLGNRFRTIGAAMNYCIKTGRKISIDWCDGMFADKGINAFDHFFEIYDFPYVPISCIHTNSFYPNSFKTGMLNEDIYKYFQKKEAADFFVRKAVNFILVIMGKCKLDNLRFRVANRCKYFEKREFEDVGGGY